MRATVCLELELEVDFDFQREERMTRHYPGCPAAVEVNSLLLNSKELPLEVFDEIMEDFQEEVEGACWDQVKDDETERKIMKAEYRRGGWGCR